VPLLILTNFQNKPLPSHPAERDPSLYVEGLADRSDVAITLDLADNVGRLPSDIELAIFRLVQECLTNIHRHSGSKTALIRVAREGESVRTEVRDHGKGMSPERLMEIQSRGSGLGIRGIRERIRQFHGEMKIESNDSGTSVIVSIPMPTCSVSLTESLA
jgi:two-component system, NarL family, sensor kinase